MVPLVGIGVIMVGIKFAVDMAVNAKIGHSLWKREYGRNASDIIRRGQVHKGFSQYRAEAIAQQNADKGAAAKGIFRALSQNPEVISYALSQAPDNWKTRLGKKLFPSVYAISKTWRNG